MGTRDQRLPRVDIGQLAVVGHADGTAAGARRGGFRYVYRLAGLRRLALGERRPAQPRAVGPPGGYHPEAAEVGAAPAVPLDRGLAPRGDGRDAQAVVEDA